MYAHTSDLSKPTLGVIAMQANRLRQLLWSLIAAMAVALVTGLAQGKYNVTVLVALALVCLGLAFRANQNGKLERATSLMLGTLVVTLSGLLFLGDGLYDVAVIAFPGLLVFGSMFGSRRLFVGLLLVMLAVLGTVFALDMAKIYVHASPTLKWGRMTNLAAILIVTSFFVWLLASDLRSALARLEADKQSLLESHARIEVLAHRDIDDRVGQAQPSHGCRFVFGLGQFQDR